MNHPTELVTKVLTFRKTSLPVLSISSSCIYIYIYIYIFISCRLDILRFDLINFLGHFSALSYIAILTLVQTQPKLAHIWAVSKSRTILLIFVFLYSMYSSFDYSISSRKIHAWDILTWKAAFAVVSSD